MGTEYGRKRLDTFDTIMLVVAGIVAFFYGAVALVGERPVVMVGKIVVWIVLVAVPVAVVAGIGWTVFRLIYRTRWDARERAVALAKNGYIVEHHQGGIVAGNTRSDTWNHFCRGSASRSVKPVAETGSDAMAEDDAPRGDALSLAMRCERGMIFGGTDAGKTFFAKRMAAKKLEEGHIVIVLDPKHYDRRKPWPEGVRLAGTGDRLEEIEWAFDWIEREKDRRGQDMDNVDMWPFVTIIVDELNELLVDRPDFGGSYIRVLRKYREYRFGVWIMGQSDRAREIGLEKRVDLKQCFNARFDIRHNPTTSERWIEVDTMSPEPVIHCPAIHPDPIRKGARPGIDWAFRHDHEGTRGGHTHTATRPDMRRNAPPNAPDDVFDAEIVSGVSVSRRPVSPNMIGHDPHLKPYLYEGDPSGPEIIEVSDPDIARIIRSVRGTPESASLRDLCRAAGQTPGGRQANRIKRIIKKHAPRMYRDRFG